MGASCPNLLEDRTCLNSLLISFTRIKEFRDIFKVEPTKELSKIFYSLCQNENEVQNCVNNFKNLIRKEKGSECKLNFQELLDFILSTLNEELNENIHKNREENIKEYAEKFCEMTNSVMERLFFGSKELVKTCKKCQKKDYNYEIFSNTFFDLSNNKSNVELKDILKEKKEEKFCSNCNKKRDSKVEIKYFNLPEIFISSFNCEDFKGNINYYLNYKINNEQYILNGFIMKKNERNEDVKDYNIFFEEDKKWYIYKTANNSKLEIKDITDIRGNPVAVFYKKTGKFYYDIYNEIINLLKDQDNTKDLINEHLVVDDNYEKYYMVNKKWFNKIIKILEEENKYTDDSFINTEENIKNSIKKRNFDLIEKHRLYSERIRKLKNLDGLDMNQEENLKIDFPKGFILIKQNVLKNFFKLICTYEIPEKYLYEAKFGENYIFIKDKIKDNNNEIIFVCYLNKNDSSIDVECILKYFNPCFNEEAEKYISNRGGIEYFYLKKELKLDVGGIQKIKDAKREETIGNLINIKNPKNHFDLGRFDLENKIDNNVNNEPGSSLKMSMFDNNGQINTNIILSKGNSNYQKWNNYNISNNNMLNQINNNNNQN